MIRTKRVACLAEGAIAANRVVHSRENFGVMSKWVYGFGGGEAEGEAAMRELLGGKGANLAEMSRIGLPAPPGNSRPR